MPRRCALGCSPKNRGLLHIFPNPDKYPEQHKAWVKIVNNNSDCDFDYKKYRVCDRHFTHRDRNRNHRLNVLAVPSLFLPDGVEVVQPLHSPVIVDSPSPMITDCEDPSTAYSAGMQSKTGYPKPGCSPNFNMPMAVELPPPVHRTSLEHNYCVSAKSQVERRQRSSKNTTPMAAANLYKQYQRTIKNLRREIYRLRKKYKILKHAWKSQNIWIKSQKGTNLEKKITSPAKVFNENNGPPTDIRPRRRPVSLKPANRAAVVYSRVRATPLKS